MPETIFDKVFCFGIVFLALVIMLIFSVVIIICLPFYQSYSRTVDMCESSQEVEKWTL